MILENSLPLGVITGEKKFIETSISRSLREENEQLIQQLEDRNEEIRVLTELVESRIGESEGSGAACLLGAFPSGLNSVDEQEEGVAKLVTNRSSMRTDDKGNPVPLSALGKF